MRIGFLIGSYNSSYALAMIKWLTRELDARKCSLVIFEGYSLINNSVSDYQCNTIYRLLSSERIDGLIILSSELAVLTGKEMLQDFALRAGIPTVSLGLELEGMPSVLMDNSSGFEKILSHLISHQYKKFAHISGPLNSSESMLRRDALLKVIYQNGLEIPNNFILEGNFKYSSGYNLTKKLIPYIKNKEIEAIVSANDQMAFGSAKCLNENGLSIPDDVALTGFDDSEMSQNYPLPLTTVSQPFEDMCRKAAGLVMDLKYGKKDSSVYTFAPHLTIRESCGCHEPVQLASGGYTVPVFNQYKISGRLQSLETENFFSALSDYLSENSIADCFIVRFMDTVRFDDFPVIKQSLRCKLFFGYSNGKRVYHTKPFEAAKILPDSIFDTLGGAVLVKHLFFGKIQFGFIIVSSSVSTSEFVEDLGVEISHYLENIYLTQEKQIAEKRLSDTLESLILTNRKLNEMTVKENLDKLNNLKYLANHMMQSRKTGSGDYYLILVEIDNFMDINSQFGFDEGEILMSSVSKVLSGSIRDNDILSHQSCDRYVILVKNAQGNAIEAIEKRFRGKMNEINSKQKHPYPISFSWGYSYAKYDSDFDRVFGEAETNLINQKKFKPDDKKDEN